MEHHNQLATDCAANCAAIIDAYGQFVVVADEMIRRALSAQCLSRARLRLIDDIRKRLVSRLCSEEFAEVVGRMAGNLAAEEQLHFLTSVRDFIARPLGERGDAVWPRLDAAREILREWLLSAESDAPVEARATLIRFDMLLRGGDGEPDELWWSLAAPR
jgi:hypothetical protein